MLFVNRSGQIGSRRCSSRNLSGGSSSRVRAVGKAIGAGVVDDSAISVCPIITYH